MWQSLNLRNILRGTWTTVSSVCLLSGSLSSQSSSYAVMILDMEAMA